MVRLRSGRFDWTVQVGYPPRPRSATSPTGESHPHDTGIPSTNFAEAKQRSTPILGLEIGRTRDGKPAAEHGQYLDHNNVSRIRTCVLLTTGHIAHTGSLGGTCWNSSHCGRLTSALENGVRKPHEMRALRSDWSLESIKTKLKHLRRGAPDQSRPRKRRRTSEVLAEIETAMTETPRQTLSVVRRHSSLDMSRSTLWRPLSKRGASSPSVHRD